jgi:hypothetical protein
MTATNDISEKLAATSVEERPPMRNQTVEDEWQKLKI